MTPAPTLSKILSVSRLRARGTCARADHLRHDAGLVRADVVVAAEPLVRGSVIHAGLAAACAGFPSAPDADAVAAACVAEAVAQDLGATDPRLRVWTQVALRAARAVDHASWRPASLPTSPQGGRQVNGPGDAAGDPPDATAGLVERRLGVALPDGDPSLGELARGWLFSFKPDAVLVHLRSGLLWLWDHKTKSEIGRVEPWTDLHLQALLYKRALREVGVEIAGAVLYTILADEPSVPKLRNDGHLREVMWATDWPTALRVIEDPAGLSNPIEVFHRDDEIYVAARASNSIRVYGIGDHGSVVARRVIAGAATQIDQPLALVDSAFPAASDPVYADGFESP